MSTLKHGAMPFLLAVLLLLPAAAPVAATTVDPSVSAAESAALTYANKERTARGLVALRLDSRVQAVAHARAATMASADVLSHAQADGNDAFDLLTAAGVTRYAAGEIIAYNTSSTLTTSAKGAITQWMNSSGHRAILLSSNYNYVGFGVAISPKSGKRYWAGVFIKGPDRTGAWTKLSTPTKQNIDATRTKVSFRWTGADTRLQVLTAGLRYYVAERRIAGGTWASYGTRTTTLLTTTWARGRTYEFRVRAVDKVGNWGSWKTVTVTL